MSIKKVAIIGGGTAGWLAANHIGHALQGTEISIDLIESPDIPPIGVGEGTVPNIRRTLQKFGIDERDLFRQCEATFKQSIKFVNWRKGEIGSETNFYHHLFDHPNKYAELTEYWLSQPQPKPPYAATTSPQYYACESNRAPKLPNTPKYEGITGYAYHFNAAKFAALLGKNATEKFGVEHKSANVSAVNLDKDGLIESLTTDRLGTLEYDFYVDCTGFSSMLLGKALQVPFVDKSDVLFIDKAIVVQVPTKVSEEIPPYTIATAHQAGWTWDITLPNRRGVGLVYCSKYMSDEQAHATLDQYLGGRLNELTPRQIPMTVGYRQQMWQKNCVALGLAQGFVEPLEATSILLTDFSAGFLAQRFPTDKSQLTSLQARFNHTVLHAWERVIDFIKLHYCLSDRDDSEFWRDNRNNKTIPETLQQKLQLWQDYSPVAEDFFSKFEVFDLDNFLYVLYGMDFNTKSQNEASNKGQKDAELMQNYGREMSQKLPSHRQFIQTFCAK